MCALECQGPGKTSQGLKTSLAYGGTGEPLSWPLQEKEPQRCEISATQECPE